MREDAFTDVENYVWDVGIPREGRTDVLERLIADDFRDDEAEVKAKTQHAGQCDHQILIHHLDGKNCTRFD